MARALGGSRARSRTDDAGRLVRMARGERWIPRCRRPGDDRELSVADRASWPAPCALVVVVARPHFDAMRLRLFPSPMFVMLAFLHVYIGVRVLAPFS